MLAHELLGEGTAVDERRVSLPFQIEDIEAQSGAHEPDIHMQALEEPLVDSGGKRQAIGGGAEDPGRYLGHAKVVESGVDLGGAMFPADLDVLELPRHEMRQPVEDQPNAVAGPAVSAEIVTVGGDDALKGSRHRLEVHAGWAVDERRHRFRESADDPVPAQQVETLAVQRLGHGLLPDALQREAAQEVGQLRFAHRNDEVLEVHRPEMHVLHAAHGHRVASVGEREFEQRARRQHMQLGHLFTEVAQRRQRFRRGLDLVQKQQVRSRRRGLSGQQLEQLQDPRRVPSGEGVAQFRVALEVHVHESQPGGAGELPHQSGFADLPRAANHDRLVWPARRPRLQIADLLTLEYCRHEGSRRNCMYFYRPPCGNTRLVRRTALSETSGGPRRRRPTAGAAR